MLKKLIKHEFRATAKIFMWLYIAFAIIAAVNALFVPFGTSEINMVTNVSSMHALLVSFYILSIAAISIGTVVIVILRFYRNLLGDEGYLMMTLPVSREQNILSKLIVAVVWNICTISLIIASIFLFIGASGAFKELGEAIRSMIEMGLPVGQWIALIIISMIVSVIAGILMLYAAMAIGPNLLKNRLGGSVLAFIIIAVASQFITIGIMAWVIAASDGFAIVYDSQTAGQGLNDTAMSQAALSVVNNITIGSLICYGFIAVACWILTRYMMTKKLNLA